MEKMLRVIYKEPGRMAELRDIPNTLRGLQGAIHGYIQAVTYKDGLVILCDEEGYIKGLEPNIFGICGPVVICREDGEDFASIKKTDIRAIMDEVAEEGEFVNTLMEAFA